MLENYFIGEYLDGTKLVGDDFTSQEISKWYEEEEEAYANLINHEYSKLYEFENINNFYGLKSIIQELTKSKKITIVCFGAAYGVEILALKKLLDKCAIIDYKIIVVDSSDVMLEYINTTHENIELKKANIDGKLEVPGGTVDLITCFGVLHHIPNISYIVSEFSRVLKPGGLMFIREPITSMGNWTEERYGCTKNERGIPVKYFQNICKNNSLKLVNQRFSFFSPLIVVSKKINIGFNSKIFIVLDRILSYLFSWNIRYFRPRFYMKFGPGSCYWILKKII